VRKFRKPETKRAALLSVASLQNRSIFVPWSIDQKRSGGCQRSGSAGDDSALIRFSGSRQSEEICVPEFIFKANCQNGENCQVAFFPG